MARTTHDSLQSLGETSRTGISLIICGKQPPRAGGRLMSKTFARVLLVLFVLFRRRVRALQIISRSDGGRCRFISKITSQMRESLARTCQLVRFNRSNGIFQTPGVDWRSFADTHEGSDFPRTSAGTEFIEDAIRLTLSERTVTTGGGPHSGMISTEIPGLNREDWSHVVVRARATQPDESAWYSALEESSSKAQGQR